MTPLPPPGLPPPSARDQTTGDPHALRLMRRSLGCPRSNWIEDMPQAFPAE